MKFLAAIIAAVLLAGCASQGDVVASGISPPPARYMAPVSRCPKTPKKSMRYNESTRRHLERVTRACARNRSSARGLQRWAKALTRD
jgi:hypothetical protein